MVKRVLIFVLFSLAAVSPAQEKDPFAWSYDGSSRAIHAGETFTVEVDFDIPPRHYLYQEKMTLDLEPQAGFSVLPLKLSASIHKADPFTGKEEDIFVDSADLTATVQSDPLMPPGDYLLKLILGYQGCSGQLCYRLMQREVLLPVQVVAGVVGSQGQQGKASLTQGSLEGIAGRGWLMGIAISFLAGVATDFTPCVLPIVPITLAFIGVRREGKKRRNFILAFLFILSMALTYAFLGLGVASLGKTLGFLFQNPYFLLFTILLYVGFSLSLFGLFEIQMPLSLRNSMAKMGGGGAVGAAIAGTTTGFLAAPCVGPLIGSLLLYVAQSHDLWRGFVFLFAFGLGMGSLFLVVGTFYQIFATKVHGGNFTLWIKRVLAILLLVPAAYYAAVLYREFHASGKKVEAPSSGFWVEDSERGFAQAVQEHKKVLIDFYASWCLPCMEMERKTFSRSDVQQEVLAHFVPIRIDCTGETPQCRALVEKYQVIGWPTLVVTDNQGKVIDKVIGRNFSPTELTDYLGMLLNR